MPDSAEIEARGAVALDPFEEANRLRQENADLKAALAKTVEIAKAAMLVGDDEWRPIEDAPKDGTPVLGWKEATREHYVVAWVRGDHPGWCTPDGYEIFRLTHFRPLPAPPVSPEARGIVQCPVCTADVTVAEILFGA